MSTSLERRIEALEAKVADEAVSMLVCVEYVKALNGKPVAGHTLKLTDGETEYRQQPGETREEFRERALAGVRAHQWTGVKSVYLQAEGHTVAHHEAR